jgi:hypothetical protein
MLENYGRLVDYIDSVSSISIMRYGGRVILVRFLFGRHILNIYHRDWSMHGTDAITCKF